MLAFSHIGKLLFLIYFTLFTHSIWGRFDSHKSHENSDDPYLNADEKDKLEALTHYAWAAYLSEVEGSSWEEVNKQYVAAIERDPSSDFLLGELLQFWFRYDSYNESTQIIEYLVPIATKNPEAIGLNLAVAHAYVEQAHFEAGRDILVNVFNKTKWADPLVIIKLVQCYHGTGEIRKGDRLLRQITHGDNFRDDFSLEQAAANFYNSVARHQRYRISRSKRYDYQTLAYEHALRAVDAIESFPGAEINEEMMELIAVLLTGKFTEQVASVLSTLRTRGKKSLDTDRLLAECYESTEQYGNALDLWKDLSNGFPLNPYYHTRMGRVLKAEGRNKDALLAFETAYQLIGNPHVGFEIATLYLLMKQPKNALEYAEKLVLNNLQAFLLLSHLYRDLGQLEQSLEVLTRAQHAEQAINNPGFLTIEYYLTLATTYFTLDRQDDTIRTLEKALELYPDNADANNFLGYYLADKNEDLRRAKKFVIKALKVDPDNPAYLDSLAWIYYRQGSYRKAAKYIGRVLNRQQSEIDGVILGHAGDIFQALGNHQKAIKYWKAALDQGVAEADRIKQQIQDVERVIK